MPLTNQFSLSLELTRMFPVDLLASDSVINLARSLQNSGSDIVIEEDLAKLFGRCQIQQQMATSFRTIVNKNETSTLNSLLGLILQWGPGPTVSVRRRSIIACLRLTFFSLEKVLRALKHDHGPYFAMVIQCSLLVFTHEKNQLATALSHAIEREADPDDPNTTLRAAPNYESIVGVLQACEDQTSSYDWRIVLLTTARALNIDEDAALSTIPPIVVQGAVTLFCLLQKLPEDRMVVIYTSVSAGACSLIVWAHQVLGLTVVVKQSGRSNEVYEETFGDGPSQVVIDLRDQYVTLNGAVLEAKLPSIVYLSVSEKEDEVLVTLRPEPDDVEIDAVYTQIAEGYGTKILEYECRNLDSKTALVGELTMLSVAFAAIISQQLYPKPRSAFAADGSLHLWANGNVSSDDNFNEDSNCTVSKSDVIGAAQFLFCETKLNMKSVTSHLTMYKGNPLNKELPIPQAISLILESVLPDKPPDYLEKIWYFMLEKVRYLAVVILTFAFVRDLGSCKQLPLTHAIEVLSRHHLILRMNQWNGTSPIWIPEDTWFLVLAELLLGHKASIEPQKTCLVSQRGWSIFLSTFGDADPSFTDAGCVVVKKGVPCRNGIWKHAIVDGPRVGRGEDWEIVNGTGTRESLRCATPVYRKLPFCGDGVGNFVISLRFSREPPSSRQTKQTFYEGNSVNQEAQVRKVRKSGYREFYAALWGVQHTKSCQHENTEMTLPLSCVSVSGFGDSRLTDMRDIARVFVCLTAHSSNARWRALLAIHMNLFNFNLVSGVGQVVLRGEDCCFQCAVAQTLKRPGHWFLVL